MSDALYICSCGNTISPGEVGDLKMGSQRPVMLVPSAVICDCGLQMRLYTAATNGGRAMINRARRRQGAQRA
jgi:hypothetical protein